MPMTLTITNLGQATIRQDANQYSNCHIFTRDVMWALSEQYEGRIHPSMFNYMGRIIRDDNPPTIYQDMINDERATLFTQQGCGTLPVGSLIIFWYGSVQHSMVATGANQWTGANNLGSLGIHNATLLGGGVPNTGIYQYNNMGQRQHNLGIDQGGWADGNMVSICQSINQPYRMYNIPVLV